MLTMMKGPRKKLQCSQSSTSAGLAFLKLFQVLRSYHVLCTMGDTDVNKTLSSASKGLRVRGRGQTYPPKTSIIQTIPQEKY